MTRTWMLAALLGLVACGDDGNSSAPGAAAGAGAQGGGAGKGGAAQGGASQGGNAQGSASQAGSGQGGASQAGSGQGGSAQGGSAQGGSAQGGSAQGGSAQGGSAQGGSAQGGSAQGGSAQAGAAQGGSAQGGSAQGGSAQAGQGGSAQAGGAGGPGQGVPFRHGINTGYFTPKVADADSAALAVKAGASSMRVKLSEQHLTTWGDDIEVGDMQSYEALGMSRLVVFLGGPTAAHSTAPAGKADWELEYYSPKNLYEPIFLPSGEVNPENYWASFVARVAKTYGKWLDVYEVWNEPDQVGGNWQATLDWEKNPPKPSDLVWWNDSIFSYIRALRVASEVIHKLDPGGQVALGGIGYPSFLGALLRYTDEPGSGAVTAEYPAKGGAYFDVLSYHYYPVFAPGNSDVGAEGLLSLKGEFAARLDAAGVSGKGWVVTESGAPRFAFDGKPGGDAYARNYLLKLMTLGHDAGLMGIDWFLLGDGKKVGASTDPFDYMGLFLNYSDVQSKDEAVITPTGVAYATLGQLLGGGLSDPQGTKALALPASVGGAAFRTKGGQRAFVLWARDGQTEGAAASYALATDKTVKVHAWDASSTGAFEEKSPQGGQVTLSLSSSPVVVIEP